MGREQEQFVRKLRSLVPTVSRLTELPQVRDSLWVARPDHAEALRRGTAAPSPGEFHLQDVGLWVPDKAFGVMPHCPRGCGNTCVSYRGWADAPRRVLGLLHHWYLDTARYTCAVCTLVPERQATFSATDPLSVAQAPLHIQLEYGLLVGHQWVYDSSVTRYFVDSHANMAEAAVAAQLNRWHRETYMKRQLRYW
jgi:hypothetical protein